MRIWIDENIPLIGKGLAGKAEIKRFNGRNLTNKDLIDLGCDVLIIRSTTKVNRQLLDGTQIKLVATATSGTDHIDNDYLDKAGVSFSDAKGSNANSVAEYVIYSILKWALNKEVELKKVPIGIIGFGCIGKLVAAFAYELGLKVFVNDPPLREEGFNFPDYCIYLELKELISNSRIVTNHVPLERNGKWPTLNLINRDLLESMPSGSFLIHASRGWVVNENSLFERINRGYVNAVVDVWTSEPFYNKELANLSLIATPHIAGYSFEGKLNGVRMMLKSIEMHTGITPDYSFFCEYENAELISLKEYNSMFRLLNRINETRQFERDNAEFSELSKLPDKERALGFDNMRKYYPARREILKPNIELIKG